jgi:hypothetical protein
MRKFWEKHGTHNRVRLEFNQLGQPCGSKTSKLTNFISTLVKSKDVSLEHKTWRKVPACEKEKLWNTAKVYHPNLYQFILFSLHIGIDISILNNCFYELKIGILHTN